MHLKYILWNKIHCSSVGVLHLARFKHVSFFPVLSNPPFPSLFLAPSALPGGHYSIWVWSNVMTDPIQGTSWNVRRAFFFSLLYCHPLFSNGSGGGCVCMCVSVCSIFFLCVPQVPDLEHPHISISHSLDPLPDGIQNWASKTQKILFSSTPWESFIVFWCYLCLHCAICSGIHLLSSASNNSVLAGEGSVGLMHRKTWGKALFPSLQLIVVLRGLNC